MVFYCILIVKRFINYYWDNENDFQMGEIKLDYYSFHIEYIPFWEYLTYNFSLH